MPFDLSALRWSKIIICTDADEDGFQILTLLLTLFYRLLPTLLIEGKVFIAESPLFEITAKDKTYFAYNEPEKATILRQLGNQKYTLQRSKGLGENTPTMMSQTTMNPATRRLIAVTPVDAAETDRILTPCSATISRHARPSLRRTEMSICWKPIFKIVFRIGKNACAIGRHPKNS